MDQKTATTSAAASAAPAAAARSDNVNAGAAGASAAKPPLNRSIVECDAKQAQFFIERMHMRDLEVQKGLEEEIGFWDMQRDIVGMLRGVTDRKHELVQELVAIMQARIRNKISQDAVDEYYECLKKIKALEQESVEFKALSARLAESQTRMLSYNENVQALDALIPAQIRITSYRLKTDGLSDAQSVLGVGNQ